MALPMTPPIRHPKTGIFMLRKRVPDELRSVIGKREEKLSLGTRDPQEAKRLHTAALAKLESRSANLRLPEKSLSWREVQAFVAAFASEYLAEFVGIPPGVSWIDTGRSAQALSIRISGWTSLQAATKTSDTRV